MARVEDKLRELSVLASLIVLCEEWHILPCRTPQHLDELVKCVEQFIRWESDQFRL
jgi:hypothetical protein